MTMLVTYLTARSTEATRAAGYATLTAGLLQIGLAVLGGIWFGAVGAAVGATLSQALLFVVLVLRSAAQCRSEQRQHKSASINDPAYADDEDTVASE
jgi:Na+-driven multidrug efflux pump